MRSRVDSVPTLYVAINDEVRARFASLSSLGKQSPCAVVTPLFCTDHHGRFLWYRT